MKKWVTAVAVIGCLAVVGVLVYWQWDPIWAFVFSPAGGFVAKILFTGKALKVIAGVAFAVGAGVVAVRRKLRRGPAEPELAPPVYGVPTYVNGNGDCHHHGVGDSSIESTHFTHQNPRRPGATSRAG